MPLRAVRVEYGKAVDVHPEVVDYERGDEKSLACRGDDRGDDQQGLERAAARALSGAGERGEENAGEDRLGQ